VNGVARLWNLFFLVGLIVLSAACSSGADELAGTWQLVSYLESGEETVVEEGANTTVLPTFTFHGQYASGNAGCNNFGDDDDYPYTYSDGVLNLGVLVKDASECETMTTELFLEDVIWSGADIAAVIADDSMTWNFGDATLTFTKLTESGSG
jgi:heat shock protein HslJ